VVVDLYILFKVNIMNEQKNEPEKLLTRDEVMKLLACNSTTIWRYTRSGKLPFYRAGRKMFFKRSEILMAIKVN